MHIREPGTGCCRSPVGPIISHCGPVDKSAGALIVACRDATTTVIFRTDLRRVLMAIDYFPVSLDTLLVAPMACVRSATRFSIIPFDFHAVVLVTRSSILKYSRNIDASSSPPFAPRYSSAAWWAGAYLPSRCVLRNSLTAFNDSLPSPSVCENTSMILA